MCMCLVPGEELHCTRDQNNDIQLLWSTIDRLPRKMSVLCSLFIHRGGSMNYGVNTVLKRLPSRWI